MDYFMMEAEINELDYIIFKNISMDTKKKFLDGWCKYARKTSSEQYYIYRMKWL